MNDFYVYMYLRSNDSKNGKAGSPYYVGKGRGSRAFDVNRRCKPPSDKTKIVFVSENMNEADAFQLEMFLIHIHGRIDKKTGCLANLTDGGEGYRGGKHTAERNRKISEWMKANPNRGQFTSSPRPERLGVPLPLQQRLKQSASWTPEKREAMKAKLRGRKHSVEQIEKNRLARLGHKQSAETIAKRSESLRRAYVEGRHPGNGMGKLRNIISS